MAVKVCNAGLASENRDLGRRGGIGHATNRFSRALHDSSALADDMVRAEPWAEHAMTGKQRIVCVGEVMVELAHGSDGRYGLAYGGDTFNTAVYLARAGGGVAYATALGDDPYSDGIVSLAAAEGVGTDLILRVPG
ncbi:MAG TPA: PfkB family carbohydrate kinase, partial [Xanthobacteraceae bacterium]|nr:PfkB family carbohydrate kinase [Xanthobacteraceae bacterium]